MCRFRMPDTVYTVLPIHANEISLSVHLHSILPETVRSMEAFLRYCEFSLFPLLLFLRLSALPFPEALLHFLSVSALFLSETSSIMFPLPSIRQHLPQDLRSQYQILYRSRILPAHDMPWQQSFHALFWPHNRYLPDLPERLYPVLLPPVHRRLSCQIQQSLFLSEHQVPQIIFCLLFSHCKDFHTAEKKHLLVILLFSVSPDPPGHLRSML